MQLKQTAIKREKNGDIKFKYVCDRPYLVSKGGKLIKREQQWSLLKGATQSVVAGDYS